MIAPPGRAHRGRAFAAPGRPRRGGGDRFPVRAAAMLAFLAWGTAAPAAPAATPRPPAPAEVTVPETGTSVPMGDFGGRPVVDVTIDGRGPFRFLLDTGALISVIDADLQRELSLPVAGPGTGPGRERGPGTVSIREIRIGGAVLRNVPGGVLPLGRLLGGDDAPRGILSAAIFPGHLVTFDHPARRVSIRRGELPRPDAATVFEYAEEEVLPSVTVRIGDREARVHVDTGSGYGLLLPTNQAARLDLASPPGSAGRLRTVRGEFPRSLARLAAPVRLGRHTLALAEVGFCDLHSGGGPPAGNLGSEALRDFVVTLDSSHRRIRFLR